MAYDPLSEKLAGQTHVAVPDLLATFARFEHLTIPELQRAFDDSNDRFRAWVEDSQNSGRPISEAPDYLDRIALDSLLERRMWWE